MLFVSFIQNKLIPKEKAMKNMNAIIWYQHTNEITHYIYYYIYYTNKCIWGKCASIQLPF